MLIWPGIAPANEKTAPPERREPGNEGIKMLEQYAEQQYLGENFNCAEAVLMAVNQAYHLGLSAESAKLVGGFGGGMGCASTCGALCGAIAAMGAVKLKGKAHEQPAFRAECAELVKEFEARLGSSCCAELRLKYATQQQRCLKTVLAACAVLESHLEEAAR